MQLERKHPEKITRNQAAKPEATLGKKLQFDHFANTQVCRECP